jgi:hypothetical protein
MFMIASRADYIRRRCHAGPEAHRSGEVTIRMRTLYTPANIIIGLDTDTPETVDHIVEFIRASNIPVLTINILYALPKTPLWERLSREGRIVEEAGRESNVAFQLPYQAVLGMWRRCIAAAYEPRFLYARYAYNQARVFPNRKRFPLSRHRVQWRNVKRGVGIVARLCRRIGVRSDYRRAFWPMAWRMLRAGRVEYLVHATVVSHPLIEFTRDCLRGAPEPSFYAPRRAMAARGAAAGRAADARAR